MTEHDAYVDEIDMKALADFVEEGLAGLGILDELVELRLLFDHGGYESAKDGQQYYNNAIAFVNESKMGDPDHEPIDFITDEDMANWGIKNV